MCCDTHLHVKKTPIYNLSIVLGLIPPTSHRAPISLQRIQFIYKVTAVKAPI